MIKLSKKTTPRIPRKKKKHFDKLVYRIIEGTRGRVVGQGMEPAVIMRAGMEAAEKVKQTAYASGLGRLLDKHRPYFAQSRIKAGLRSGYITR